MSYELLPLVALGPGSTDLLDALVNGLTPVKLAMGKYALLLDLAEEALRHNDARQAGELLAEARAIRAGLDL